MITAKIQTTSGKVFEATRDVDLIVSNIEDWQKFVSIWNEYLLSDSIIRIYDIIPEEDLWEKIHTELEENEEKNDENEKE